MLLRRSAALIFIAAFAHAAVTRVEVAQRVDLPLINYEQITGKVYFAVDPKLPANKIIVDLDRAPRNAQGLVEFSADLFVLRPKDAAKSNGTALLEISNRGSQPFFGALNIGGGRGMRTVQDLGDHFMLDQGYTLIWVGWQFDVAGAN